MTKTTISIDGATFAVLAGALIGMLDEETERLGEALMRSDRDAHPERARSVYRRMRRVGGLLEQIGWGAGANPGRIRIDLDRELPIALAALRKERFRAQESAKDSRLHGDAEEAIRATTRLHEVCEALLSLEVQDIRLRGDGGDDVQ